ncbi:hypothetical protein [Fimbriiglobus ruber]|nr:hypothetical protein [Fimbriiglobus ruber]
MTSPNVLPHLIRLDVEGGSIGDRAASLFASLPFAERVEELGLASNRIGPEGIRAMFGPSTFAKLTRLNLDGNRPGDAVVIALTESARVPYLRHLELAGLELTRVAAEAIANWPTAASLRYLDLSGNSIDVSGVRALTQSPYLRDLQTLDLVVGDAGRSEILRRLWDRFGLVETIPRPGYGFRAGRLSD